MTTASMVEPLHLRSCLSRFVTGVVVVSYRAEGEVRGVTVNSFTSVSLDPPLVLVSVARSARAAGHLGRVPFSINVHEADAPGDGEPLLFDRGRFSHVGVGLRVPCADVRAA